MKFLSRLFLILLVGAFPVLAETVHVWEKQELTFTAANQYTNAYTEVTVWVDLAGLGSANGSLASGMAARLFE